MAEVKHTTGDWTFDNRSLTGAVWAGKEFVASVYPNAPEGWDGHSDYERLDEMRANARLIAAAPDLFEAGTELQAARKAQNADASAENASRVRAASDAFDAALSKATAQQEGR